MSRQYINELTPEILAGMDQSPFSAENLAAMNAEARELIEERGRFRLAHPVTAIFRIATEGSLTRDGGTVCAPDRGHQLKRDDGSRVNVALAGDVVEYPDGRTAKIVSSAGVASAIDGVGVALVGSELDNGDEIISTPQGHSWLVRRDGMTDSILAVNGRVV